GGSTLGAPGLTCDRHSCVIVDRAIEFIQKDPDRPFFVNVWLTDPHSILAPTKEQMDVYKSFAPPEVADRFTSAKQVYYSVVTDMDAQVGRLIRRIDELGLGRDTLILFTSDSGPAPIWGLDTVHSGAGSTGPFRGCK